MFAEAVSIASRFTRPVIISTRRIDGTVSSAIGSFVILNEEGWILTVAHLWQSYFEYKKHESAVKRYRDELASIKSDTRLSEKKREKLISSIEMDKGVIQNHSFWWGEDGVVLKDIKSYPEGDIITGRLEPFNKRRDMRFPVIKNPDMNLDIGTSLCKLGYPFHKIKASFDEDKGAFILPGKTAPALFPIEGIFTRHVIAGRSKRTNKDIKFLETSSPGLMGQSGGPIFDTKGTIWAIQSRTVHFPLGFSPKIKKRGKEIEENQFLNVGWGVHPTTVVQFLGDSGIDFRMSNY
ncbi:MAG TPA: serine protease [Kosmotogaceae bacterium]|nr:MAG: Uncharacterized protein XE05_0990 [Thermotogales bacterium 46_20]HAA85131.1 serine protease [Kosmotogaceae bacterium]